MMRGQCPPSHQGGLNKTREKKILGNCAEKIDISTHQEQTAVFPLHSLKTGKICSDLSQGRKSVTQKQESAVVSKTG